MTNRRFEEFGLQVKPLGASAYVVTTHSQTRATLAATAARSAMSNARMTLHAIGESQGLLFPALTVIKGRHGRRSNVGGLMLLFVDSEHPTW